MRVYIEKPFEDLVKVLVCGIKMQVKVGLCFGLRSVLTWVYVYGKSCVYIR